MDFRNELHARALAAALNFKEAEKVLQEILRQIDEHKTYYDLGYRSLMDYAISGLGLTPDVAYNQCTVAKKSQTLPEVRKAISEGVLSVSAVRHMAPILTKENEKEMIELGSKLTQSELRREVAKRNPEQTEVPEKARYVREDRLALEFRISEELMKKLRRAQDLVSQSQREFSSLEDTLEAMVDVFLEKKDPIKKAERAHERAKEKIEKDDSKENDSPQKQLQALLSEVPSAYSQPQKNSRIIRKNQDLLTGSPPSQKRTPIPAQNQHEAILKYGGRCTHIDSKGKRCNQTRWLHIHHIQPLSQGGNHRAENLTLLCGGHHRMHHRIAEGSAARNSHP